MNIPIITRHAKKRLKERLGLSKRAHIRHIRKVLKEGSYLYRDKDRNIFYMLHNYSKYVFGLTNQHTAVLITVYLKNLK